MDPYKKDCSADRTRKVRSSLENYKDFFVTPFSTRGFSVLPVKCGWDSCFLGINLSNWIGFKFFPLNSTLRWHITNGCWFPMVHQFSVFFVSFLLPSHRHCYQNKRESKYFPKYFTAPYLIHISFYKNQSSSTCCWYLISSIYQIWGNY